MNGKEIAKLYENAVHSPNDVSVIEAYKQFAIEIEKQFETLPITVLFVDNDAYTNSKEMFSDIEANGVLKVWNGGTPHELMANVNNKFRAIHDYFGHYLQKNSFSYTGETAAYFIHSKMFSPIANKALFTETIAQNSWFNFSDENIDKPNSLRKFAEQKAVIF